MASATDLNFIAAIELGSSKITGIAGKKLLDGSIQVLALASESSDQCIRNGVIYNLDRTAQSLTSIINRLESTLKAVIGKVYVGVSGQSLRTLLHTQTEHFEEETKITQELVDYLLDKNRDVPMVDQEILEVAPQEYKVGNNLLIEPVGILTDRIEGRFLNIIAKTNVKQNIDKCFKQANIEIADYIIAPLALAENVLSNTERRSGCVLVDFGADTTTIAVYNKNILRHLAVIPLGGNNITKDICSQQIEEEDAEALKVRYGDAWAEPINNDEEQETYSVGGRCTIEASLLNKIVEARANEILANVWNQVILSGYNDKLLAGAILTGGGSNLKNIDVAFSNITHIDKVRIARETIPNVKGNVEINKDGSKNTILSILLCGKENCCIPKQKEKEKQKDIPSGPDTLFTEEGESAEEENKRIVNELREKKLKEEAEKKLREDYQQTVNEIKQLIEQKNHKEAKSKLDEIRQLGLKDKEDEMDILEKTIKELKKKNSIFGNFINKIGQILDEEK